MGRGKRISEWPGNIHFRQVVNQHRDEYHRCSRKEKVKVANVVLEKIQGIGGRFLQQKSNEDTWEEVEYERAIEKACQALREKEKSRPPETSPFEDKAKKDLTPPKAPQSSRPAKVPRRPGKVTLILKKNKVKRGSMQAEEGDTQQQQEKDNHEDDQSTITDEDATSADESGNEEDEPEESTDDGNDEKVKTTAEIKTLENFRDMPDDKFFTQLETFKEMHGHCAVPPHDCLKPVSSSVTSDDNGNETLANWCTVQRQIYREIQSKYRKATEVETQRIKKLDELGFCWDYEPWHWDQSFQILQKEMKEATDKKIGLGDKALHWILDQRQRGKRGMPQPSQRIKKLKTLGVSVV